MVDYRHLYYFWVVAREGGFARAAERLDMTIQTCHARTRSLSCQPTGCERYANDMGMVHSLRLLGRRQDMKFQDGPRID